MAIFYSERGALVPHVEKSAKAKAGDWRIESYRWFWESLEGYLAKKNLKQTRQRRRIVELFISLNTHASAEVLHKAVREDGHNVGLATVYRTLNILVDAGLVDQKSFGEGRFVYEIKTPGEHHDHLICLDCGTVIEFEDPDIEDLQEKVAGTHQFKLVSHRLDLFGHCQKQSCEHRR